MAATTGISSGSAQADVGWREAEVIDDGEARSVTVPFSLSGLSSVCPSTRIDVDVKINYTFSGDTLNVRSVYVRNRGAATIKAFRGGLKVDNNYWEYNARLSPNPGLGQSSIAQWQSSHRNWNTMSRNGSWGNGAGGWIEIVHDGHHYSTCGGHFTFAFKRVSGGK